MGEELHRQFNFVDYVCPGEADESFPVLAALLLTKTAKAAALPRGIVYRENGRSFSTGRSVPVRNMDALPFPDFSNFSRDWSESGGSLVAVPTVLIETSRGCWWGDKSRHARFVG